MDDAAAFVDMGAPRLTEDVEALHRDAEAVVCVTNRTVTWRCPTGFEQRDGDIAREGNEVSSMARPQGEEPPVRRPTGRDLVRPSPFALVIVVFTLGFAVACVGSDSSSDSSSDAPRETVTLRLGTNDPEDAPIAPVIEEFARQVAEHSDGTIAVEPVWRAVGDPPLDDWDQAVAQKVIDGELELALIPSAAWDAVGVSTLRALNAPFLVDSDKLVEAIVTSDLETRLLAGLDAVGITGLTLLPEGLRHVFAFGETLVSPSDFAGVTIRVPRSDTVYALFEALGATAVDTNGAEFDAAVEAGELAGAESSFRRAGSLPGELRTATGNVTLFPKVNALVVNASVFEALSDDQQAALRDAAAATRAYTLGSATSDTQAAREFCDNGGGIVIASDADRAALAAAVEPVYADLETDAATRDLIARIRGLKADSQTPPEVAACQPDEPGGDAAGPTDRIPLGSYERTVTRAEGLERGIDPDLVDELLGPDGVLHMTLEITDGRWKQHLIEDNGDTIIGDLGTYTYDDEGHWVTVSTSSGCNGCTAHLDWTFQDGVLTLTFALEGFSDDEDLMVQGVYTLEG